MKQLKEKLIMAFAVVIPVLFTGCNKVSIQGDSSISVIGGSDGPTTTFVAGKVGIADMLIAIWPLLVVILFLVIAVVVGLILFRKAKKMDADKKDDEIKEDK